MYVVAIAWLYVAMMMAVGEATASNGSVGRALFMFVLYGALPVALLVYVVGLRARGRERKRAAAVNSGAPDRGGETPAGAAVAPMREEP